MDEPTASEEKELFSCRIFRVLERFQRGRSGAIHKRYVVAHPGGVGILPITDDGRVILVRQYRTAVGRRIVEIPAGTRESGEEPIETARRELIEETGYRAKNLSLIASFWSSPGFLSEKINLVLATGLTAGESSLEDGEDLSVFSVDSKEIRRMIHAGEIEDGKTLVALLWFLNRENDLE